MEQTAEDLAQLGYDELRTRLELERIYNELCTLKFPDESDIVEHLPTLRGLAEELGPEAHVTEFGTRGAISTVAFLAARPKRLVCYDLFRSDNVDRAERLVGETEFVFHRQDVLTADIEETDLLFIDTWHVYGQLKEELRLHSAKARKYIVLHDTTSYGETGEDGGTGLWPAVVEFLSGHGEWTLKDRYENCNGLTVLERVRESVNGFTKRDAAVRQDAKRSSPYRAWLKDEPAQRQPVGRRTQFICRATPIRPHGMVSAWWSRAVEALLRPMNMGWGIHMWQDKVGGEIAEARNALVCDVLDFETRADAHEVSHIFWLDDDVLPMRGALMQLRQHDADIACGTYFSKAPDPASEPLIFPKEGHGPCNFVPNLVVHDVWGHGMGLTLVKLFVYKRMRDELELPPDKYGRPQWYRTTLDKDDGYVQEDDGTVYSGETEDFWFLRNCDRLGIKRCVDTTKHAFGFHFDPATDNGYPLPQWRQYLAGEKIVWPTAKGEIVWD